MLGRNDCGTLFDEEKDDKLKIYEKPVCRKWELEGRGSDLHYTVETSVYITKNPVKKSMTIVYICSVAKAYNCFVF